MAPSAIPRTSTLGEIREGQNKLAFGDTVRKQVRWNPKDARELLVSCVIAFVGLATLGYYVSPNHDIITAVETAVVASVILFLAGSLMIVRSRKTKHKTFEDYPTPGRAIYARDNPEKMVDLNGHMYAGRMWTDYDDQAFMATLVATTAPGGQTVYLAPTTTSTTYVGGSTITTSTTTFVGPGGSTVNYVATSTTTGVVTSTTSRTTGAYPSELGPGGATEPVIGTTSQSQTNSILGALGVIGGGLVSGVAVLWGGLKVASAVAARAGIEGILPDTFAFAGPLVAAAPFLFGTGFAIGYIIRTEQSGQTPTWQGAWNAFQEGFKMLVPPF